MHKVAVLMSTYNGDKYLREQIDSILAQKGVDLTLFIRDDGSSDRTIDIVRQYLAREEKIVFFSGKNVGVGNSFMKLLYNCPDDYDYYAFSDQDDIWELSKLAVAINQLQKTKKALLYTCNQELIDKNGCSLGYRFPEDYQVYIELEALIQTNKLSGCTYVFTKQLKRMLSAIERRPSSELLRNRIHDVWVAAVAALDNGIIYDKKAHIKYRQHENNVVGAYDYGFLYDIKRKLRKIKNPELRNGRSSISMELCRAFPEKAIKYPIIYCCKDGLTLSTKLFLLKNNKVMKKYTNETYIGLLGKIIFGFY